MNITKLYKQLNEGTISKQFFVKEARRQFPNYISPVTSYQDCVKILKGKRLISESEQVEEAQNVDEDLLDIVLKFVKDPDDAMKFMRKGFPDWLQANLDRDEDYKKYTQSKKQDKGLGEHGQYADRVADVNADSTPLKESHTLNTYQILDRMSPYSVKKGIEIELQKEKVVDETTLDKVKTRVAKKLKKNPKAYSDAILANQKEVQKTDDNLKHQEVKNTLIDTKNKMVKPKGFKAEKANTKASKKENRKGKPKGVKVMPDKGVTGSEKILKEDEFRFPTVVPKEGQMYFWTMGPEYLPIKYIGKRSENPDIETPSSVGKGYIFQFDNGKYIEIGRDTLYNYVVNQDETDGDLHPGTMGDEASAPREGKINEIKQTILNELKKSLSENIGHNHSVGQQVNTPDGPGTVTSILGGTLTVQLDSGDLKNYQMNIIDKASRDAHFSSMKGFGSVLQNPVEEDTSGTYGKITPAEEEEIKKELPDAEFEADEDEDTKYTHVSSNKATEDEIRAIIKKVLGQKGMKEAKKFKAGGETVFKSDREATDYEKDLKKAGVKYTKANV